jgi:hypothetical protein
MYTEVPVIVPRHEADLLRAVHSGNVDLLDEEPVGFFEVGAVYEERDRLRMKYGVNSQGVEWADAVYPNDTALAQAIHAGAVSEQEPPTRDELKAALDALGVEYKGNASTETLAALVAEHAPAV